MGVDYHVYIGPYVIARFEGKYIRVSAGFRRCQNKSCAKPQSYIYSPAKFCDMCGQEGEEVFKNKVVEPKPYSLVGETPLVNIKYVGQEPYAHCFILNNHSCINRLIDGKSIYLDPTEDEKIINYEDIDMVGEIDLLRINCQDQLKIIEDNYTGAEILWGIILWTS